MSYDDEIQRLTEIECITDGKSRKRTSTQRFDKAPPKADIGTQQRDVRFVPKADIHEMAASAASALWAAGGELLAHRLVHRVGRFTSESRTIERFARADRAIASDVVFFISSQKGSTDA
jgi:hypothetical protein